jgi:hypothetical protein
MEQGWQARIKKASRGVDINIGGQASCRLPFRDDNGSTSVGNSPRNGKWQRIKRRAGGRIRAAKLRRPPRGWLVRPSFIDPRRCSVRTVPSLASQKKAPRYGEALPRGILYAGRLQAADPEGQGVCVCRAGSQGKRPGDHYISKPHRVSCGVAHQTRFRCEAEHVPLICCPLT